MNIFLPSVLVAEAFTSHRRLKIPQPPTHFNPNRQPPRSHRAPSAASLRNDTSHSFPVTIFTRGRRPSSNTALLRAGSNATSDHPLVTEDS